MLAVRSLSVSYGRLPALQTVDIDVQPGEFVTIVGPNGAGKTTLLKAISGTAPAESGSIVYEGAELGVLPAHERARRGIIHVPQGRRVFGSLNVHENLVLGAYRPGARATRRETLALVFELFPVLHARRHSTASSLSGGQQQMLALGRGLMGNPRLLMLDEPSLGLSPKLVEEVFDAIRTIRARAHVAILLVEQRAAEALELCDRGYVLEGGQIGASGAREALLQQEAVQRAYLGDV